MPRGIPKNKTNKTNKSAKAAKKPKTAKPAKKRRAPKAEVAGLAVAKTPQASDIYSDQVAFGIIQGNIRVVNESINLFAMGTSPYEPNPTLLQLREALSLQLHALGKLTHMVMPTGGFKSVKASLIGDTEDGKDAPPLNGETAQTPLPPPLATTSTPPIPAS